MIFFSKQNIIFLEMEKFHWWITRRDIEWAHHVSISSLLGMQLNLIRPLVKEFLPAMT